MPNRPLGTPGTSEQFGSVRRGYYFIRPDDEVRRNIATSSSHPLFDGKTGHIVASLFDHGTRSFAVTGTHRCFSNTYSACSGTTFVCGQSEKNRETDSAHVSNSFFQFFNEEVFIRWQDTVTATSRDAAQAFVHLQQHGMESRSTTDSFVSNGVVADNMPKFSGGLANTLAEFLSDEMTAYGAEHGFDNSQQYTGFSCNSDEHAGQVSLCGSTNTLGR